MINAKISSALLTLAAVFGLSSPTPAEANLVTNGTFNTDASGWSLSSMCSDSIWLSSVGNGGGAVRLNECGQSNSDPTAAQTVFGLSVGTSYTLQWDEKLYANSSGGGFGKSFGVFLDSEPANPLVLNEFLDTSWHTVSTTFIATSTSAMIIFAAELDTRTAGVTHNTDVAYYIDNISLDVTNGVPEPTSLALAALGLVGLGWARTKKA